MAKIRNVILPPELNECLVPVLDQIPDSLMAELGKFLPGGFTRPPLIKARLAEILKTDKPVPQWLLPLLSANTPGIQVMRALSIEALTELVDAFVLLKGRDSTALPLLLDEREEAFRLGAEVLARKPHFPLEADYPGATHRLCEFIDYHLLCLADIKITLDDGEAPEPPATPLPPEFDVQQTIELIKVLPIRLKEKDEEVKKLQANLKEQSEKHHARLKKAVQKEVEERKKIRAARDEARQNLAKVTAEKETLAHQLEEFRTDMQAEVERRTSDQTSALVRKWLAGPLEQERVLEIFNSDDLLIQAQQALEAQARQDRATGNRLELGRRIERLRKAYGDLSKAAQNALRPLPEVRTVLASLEDELRRGENLLSGRKSADSLTEKLLVAISVAENWSEAQNKSQLVQQIMDAELVPKKDRRRLYDGLQRKLSLLAETISPAETDATDHGWSLRQTIYRDQPGLIMLDGHNILFGLEDIFGSVYDKDGHPGRKARERLIALASHLVKGRGNLKIRIHFDSPRHEITSAHANVEVEFSGGRGDHRADHRISEQVAWRKPDELEQKWYVVTDDWAVRKQAVSNGARYVPVDVFAVLLSDFQCLRKNGSNTGTDWTVDDMDTLRAVSYAI